MLGRRAREYDIIIIVTRDKVNVGYEVELVFHRNNWSVVGNDNGIRLSSVYRENRNHDYAVN